MPVYRKNLRENIFHAYRELFGKTPSAINKPDQIPRWKVNIHITIAVIKIAKLHWKESLRPAFKSQTVETSLRLYI